MSREDEDMVRRALEEAAMEYQPSDWADRAAAVHDRSVRRRRGVRSAVAVTLTVGAMAATAVVGVALAGSPGSAQAGHTGAAQAPAHVSATPAGPQGGHAPAPSPSKASLPAFPRPLVVPAGQDLNFGHQIWMRLTARERCEGLGPAATRGYSCKSVTDGNQPQGTVGLQSDGDVSGTLYSPLYIGPGDVTGMTVAVNGRTYAATVVKLAGHPGYATAYLWVPGAGIARPGGFPDVVIKVYDAAGKVLASFAPPSHA